MLELKCYEMTHTGKIFPQAINFFRVDCTLWKIFWSEWHLSAIYRGVEVTGVGLFVLAKSRHQKLILSYFWARWGSFSASIGLTASTCNSYSWKQRCWIKPTNSITLTNLCYLFICKVFQSRRRHIFSWNHLLSHFVMIGSISHL